MKTFEEVRAFLKTIPYIHAGGCGISAFAMFLWLKKNKKLPNTFRFVYFYDRFDSDYYQINQKALNDDSIEPTSAAHIGIEYMGSMIDCYKIISDRDYVQKMFVADENFVIKSLNSSHWNEMFDRKNMRIIEEKLQIDMSMIRQ